MKSNKNGSIPDFIFYIVFIVVLSIVIAFSWFMQNAINNNIQADNNLDAISKTFSQRQTDRFVGIFDSVFFLSFVGVFLAIAIGAWFIYTHPSMYWLLWPIAFIVTFIALFFGNIIHGFSNNDTLITYFQAFPIMSFILDNWIKLIVAFFVILLVLLNAKGVREQTQ